MRNVKVLFALAGCLLFAQVDTVSASTTTLPSNVQLVGDSQGLISIPEDEPFLIKMGMLPGDRVERTMIIQNDYEYAYDLFLRAERVSEQEEYDLLTKLELSVYDGDQLIYDQKGEIIEIDYLLRQNALQIGLDELVELIHCLGGLAIPAHINRDYCSIKSQIGFLDPESDFDAVELSRFEWVEKRYKAGDLLEGFPVISGSDSHFLEDIGTFYFELHDDNCITDFTSLKKYLRGIKDKN